MYLLALTTLLAFLTSGCRTLGMYEMPTLMDPSMIAYQATVLPDERALVTVTAQLAPGVEYHLRAVVDGNGRMLGLRLYEPDQVRSLSLDQLAHGVVLVETEEAEVVSIRSRGFDPEHGGTITLRTLRSATWATHRELTLEIKRGRDKWLAFSAHSNGGRRPFTRVRLVGLRGVTRVELR